MFKIKKIIYTALLFLFIVFPSTKVEAAEEVPTTTPQAIASTPQVVEAQVREYFADIPVMIDIAKCESNFRQFTDSGSVLRGGGEFVGIFQIYESVHAKAATALGFDLATVEGNMSYARHLYEQSGTTPWKSCVPEMVSTNGTPITSEAAKIERIKLLNQIILLLKQVMALQALLAGR